MRRVVIKSLCLLLFLTLIALPPSASAKPLLSAGADANGDGAVDLHDLVIVALAYNPDAPASDARADLSFDGVVDLFDLVLVAVNYGSTTIPLLPPEPPTSQLFPENEYTLTEERVISGYAVRVWHDADGFPFSDMLTIDANGQPRQQVEQFHHFDPLSGSDITGEGNPDVVVHCYTGGAHCCFSTIVYDLGQSITRPVVTPLSNCDATFEQLDMDAALEIHSCDDSFAYVFCCYAGSPLVRVIMDYEPLAGYVPASPRFWHLYASDIALHSAQAEHAVPDAMCEDDGTTKCGVLPLVLDYLYAGMSDLAWAELERLYDYPDLETFRTGIEDTANSSELFVAP